MASIVICSSRSTTLLLASAAHAAGLSLPDTHTNADEFLKRIASNHPQFALLTNECLDTPELLTDIRQSNQTTKIVVCILPGTVTDVRVWQIIDTLEIDVLCTLPELTDCLLALQTGKFYRSSLIATHPAFVAKEAFPGWHDLSGSERRVLHSMVEAHKGPEIADLLHISPKTVNNHKAKISQKLNITGGPGSLIRFVLLNREKLKQLLD